MQDNERLQKEKAAAERKLQRLAHRFGLQRGVGTAIGGDTSSRVDQLERQACTAVLSHGSTRRPNPRRHGCVLNALHSQGWGMRQMGQRFAARRSMVAVLFGDVFELLYKVTVLVPLL